MIPTALLFSRYRAFLEETRLDLAPLTIVIGKNGSGKSVITRLPLLIAGGVSSQADSPIDLMSGGISHAKRFEDLIHKRSAQPFSLGAEISDGTHRLTFRSTLRHVVERHSLALEAFELSENGKRSLKLTIASPEGIGDSAAEYIVERDGDQEPQSRAISIAGLFPTAVNGNDELTSALTKARLSFESAFRRPSYLGPFRSELGSLPQIPRQGAKHIGPRGERALDILGDDVLRGKGALASQVEKWFDSAMNGNRVSLVRDGSLPRLVVHDPLRKIDVELLETGAGFAQVFPIVVQAFAKQSDRIDSPLVITEQPELHLHPAAHGDVADLIGETAVNCQTTTRYLCETHSEQFISRLRRRVAEGKIPPGAVRIISVGHQSSHDSEIEPLRVIALDESGTPDAWPAGVFDEAFDDLVRMREAVRADGGQNPPR